MTELTTGRTLKQIESALSRQGINPLELYNYPKGHPQLSRPIIIPGCQSKYLNLMIEAAVIHYCEYHTYPTLSEMKHYCEPPVPYLVLSRTYRNETYLGLLAARGLPPVESITVDKTSNTATSVEMAKSLHPRQLLALSIMTDVSSRMTLKTRLSRAGIDEREWQNWLRNEQFRNKFEKISREVFIKSQSSIDLQVASGALDGKLEFIKYYNEITGRFDPKTRSRQDIQQVLQAVVEIITRNVTDPVILNRISSELQMQLNALDL